MKRKSFLSQSSHILFLKLVEDFMSGKSFTNTDDEGLTLVKTGVAELESIYSQYKGKFDDLHRLIAEYETQEIKIRKNIRVLESFNSNK
jgi:hypothetical protein